jgi:Gluconate 2-dehydrogenase subunit 3
MDRRQVIRNIVLISAGVTFLPVACRNADKVGIRVKNISLSGREQDMLAELVETIIPQTNNFPGAKDLKCHEFVLTMINDCASPEAQNKFLNEIEEFDKFCHLKFRKAYTAYTAEQKYSLLADIENKKGTPENVLNFYGTIKRYTLQGFTSSKQYMLDIKKYIMAPGPHFKGCILLKKGDNNL